MSVNPHGIVCGYCSDTLDHSAHLHTHHAQLHAKELWNGREQNGEDSQPWPINDGLTPTQVHSSPTILVDAFVIMTVHRHPNGYYGTAQLVTTYRLSLRLAYTSVFIKTSPWAL
jgi:hypothetical protein